MKSILKQLLKYYLKFFTKLVLLIYRPVIIVVAGSINKPFVKDEIKKVLSKRGVRVRANPKNFNTEIGLPLAILDLPSGYNEYHGWLKAIKGAPGRLLVRDFPRYLILSLGTSEPGDMKYLLSIVKPTVAVITDISQRYLESFSDMDELVNEYVYLTQKLPASGLLVLNCDNPRTNSLADKARCPIVSFGLNDAADWRASGITKLPLGQKMLVTHQKESSRLSIDRFGVHHIYSCLAGLIIDNYARTNQ